MNRGWRLAEVSRDEEKEAEKLGRVLFVKEREKREQPAIKMTHVRERERKSEKDVCARR